MSFAGAVSEGAQRIDLWLVRLDAVRDPALLDRYRQLLDRTEREQVARLRFESDRRRCLVWRALTRCAL